MLSGARAFPMVRDLQERGEAECGRGGGGGAEELAAGWHEGPGRGTHKHVRIVVAALLASAHQHERVLGGASDSPA
jgi:hypothetical protein